jgi:ABC-type amino acid transport substrate-binding protein
MRAAGRLQAEDVVSDAQNFSKLEAARIDAVVTIEQSGRKLLASDNYPSVQALGVPLTTKTAHLAFNRTLNKGALLARFDAAMDALRRSGEYDRIVERTMTPP